LRGLGWYKKKATRKDTRAILHQGRYKPAAKLSKVVKIMVTANRRVNNPAVKPEKKEANMMDIGNRMLVGKAHFK
jgi:hypothetical protein